MSKDQYYKRFESLFSSPDSVTPEPITDKALPVDPESTAAAAASPAAAQLGTLQARVADLESALTSAATARVRAEEEGRQIQQALARRTDELALVLQVSLETTTVLEPTQLLQRVIELVQSKFDLYYVQVFLLDETGDTLTLTCGVGAAGEQLVSEGVRIQLDQEPSLVAQAARQLEPVIVQDVADSPDYLAHPALPDTRSEMALRLGVGNKLLGVLDVQADQPGRFTEDEARLLTLVAAQISVAFQNARRQAQTQTALQEMDSLTRRLTHQGWQDYVSTQAADRLGYVYDFNEIKRLSEGEPAVNGHGPTIEQALTVRGAKIGRLAVTAPSQDEEAAEIIAAVADRLGTHVDNLRLLEEAEQARGQLDQRARELEAIGKVAAAAATVLDADQLLQTVVDLTQTSLNLYHTQIYLVDPTGQQLVLAAGAGEVGLLLSVGGQSLPLDRSPALAARCARERRGLILNNVGSEPGYQPDPLLPDVRSELAVPMIVGDSLLGVFQVQAAEPERFTEQDVQLKTTLAEQVAVALQNARSYAEQASTVERLRELDQLKTSFLANISHELRTPLNSILGFTQVILENIDGNLSPAMENDVKVIQTNGQHLLAVISDILDMAKINAGKLLLAPEIFDLREILEEVVDSARPLADAKLLTTSLDPGPLPTLDIYADRIRIKQALLNLVNNAIKFTDAGRVDVLAYRREAQIYIQVRDTGIGIAPANLEKIFDEFTQLDASTTRRAGGTGLGLPISRHLVQLHGGKLWAESDGRPGPEGGSTFTIELPVETTYIQ